MRFNCRRCCNCSVSVSKQNALLYLKDTCTAGDRETHKSLTHAVATAATATPVVVVVNELLLLFVVVDFSASLM